MTARVKLSAPDIGHLRLLNQRMVGSSLRDPEQVVRWMLALQAQDFPGAKWSVGLRCPESSDAAVTAALATGTIVRSWPMRGTLHVTAADDLHWILALTTPRLVSGAAARRNSLQLDEKTLERARGVAIEALNGGRTLTRAQMLAELDRRGVSPAGQRGYHMLWYLAQTGTLCFGAPQGSEQTFVLLDEWVQKPRRLEREQALGELAQRYFTSHGPATMKDFAGWTKLIAADLKVGLANASATLMELEVGDITYYMARESEALLSTGAHLVREHVALLPGFDEYILGYQDRSAVLAHEHRGRIVPGGNGMFMPTVVAGGEVVATWRRVARAKHAVISIAPFRKLSRGTERAIEHAAEAHGRFWAMPNRVQPTPARKESAPGPREPASRKRGKVESSVLDEDG